MEEAPSAATGGNAATFERRVYIGVPAEEVWSWLVDPERVQRYSLSDLLFRPTAVGDPIQFMSRLGGQLLIDGLVEEIVEGRRLVYTFQFQFDDPEPPSRVTYELIRYGERMCCLELRHEGLEPGGPTWDSVSKSWDVALSSLKTLIETGSPLPWPGRPR
jgi:uncharacterized protein YndB with AHSA1/START domain